MMETASGVQAGLLQPNADMQHNGVSPDRPERTSPTSPTEAMRLDLSSLVAMKSLIEDKISEETVRAQQEDVEHVTTAVSLREGIDSDDDATDDASPPISPESTTTTGSASDDSVLFNERPAPLDQTVRNFPKRCRYGHRAAQSSGLTAFNRTRTGGTNPLRALELLRVVLQPSFEKQIVQVCQSYIELLRMAATNLQENCGEAIADIHVINAIRKSLEEVGSVLDPAQSPQEYEQDDRSVREHRKEHGRKRKLNHKESNGRQHAVKHSKVSVQVKDIEASGMTWHPNDLGDNTQFIMGVKANKALGFGATRGRLYYRHPELYKYAGDQDDKLWLYDNGHMPVTGGKAYLMLQQDVAKLASSFPEYVNNPNIVVEDLVGFTVPTAMVEKMKRDMQRQKDTMAFL